MSPQTYTLYCETLDGYGKGGRGQGSVPRGQNREEGKGFSTLDSGGRAVHEQDKESSKSNLQEPQLTEFLHDWRSLSVYGHATRTELLKILSYGTIFFLILSWVDDRSKLLRLLYLMVLTAASISVIGMVQRFLGAEKIYGLWKPIFREDPSFFGTYVNPNHFAGYIALIIPLAVVLFIRQIERIDWSKSGGWRNYLRPFNEQDFYIALFLSLALVFMVSGLFVSLSRGGILAFAGSMIFLIMVLSFKEGWRWWLGFGLMAGVFALLFAFWLGFVPFEARIKTFSHLFQDATVQYRLQIWKDGWKMLLDFPLFGTGLGTFAHIYPKYKTIFSQATVMHPENDFLQILLETGLVGFGVYVWFFVAFFRALWIRWKGHETNTAHINPKVMVGLTAGIVALLIHGIGDFNLHIPANAFYFAIVMALALSIKGKRIKKKGQ
jgi:O-antigen ligase